MIGVISFFETVFSWPCSPPGPQSAWRRLHFLSILAQLWGCPVAESLAYSSSPLPPVQPSLRYDLQAGLMMYPGMKESFKDDEGDWLTDKITVQFYLHRWGSGAKSGFRTRKSGKETGWREIRKELGAVVVGGRNFPHHFLLNLTW